MARANKGMGGGVAGGNAGPDGHQAPGKPDGKVTENDLGNEIMGDAGQQGTDPNRLSNTRETSPGPQPEPDQEITDSFRKMDKDVRASEDLGKGNRYSGDHPKNDKPTETV